MLFGELYFPTCWRNLFAWDARQFLSPLFKVECSPCFRISHFVLLYPNQFLPVQSTLTFVPLSSKVVFLLTNSWHLSFWLSLSCTSSIFDDTPLRSSQSVSFWNFPLWSRSTTFFVCWWAPLFNSFMTRNGQRRSVDVISARFVPLYLLNSIDAGSTSIKALLILHCYTALHNGSLYMAAVSPTMLPLHLIWHVDGEWHKLNNDLIGYDHREIVPEYSITDVKYIYQEAEKIILEVMKQYLQRGKHLFWHIRSLS